MAPAALAVRQMSRQLTAFPDPQPPDRPPLPSSDERARPLAAAPADQLLILLGQPAPRAEQRALDDRLRHPQARADFTVGQALELPQDQDAVVKLRYAPERPA